MVSCPFFLFFLFSMYLHLIKSKLCQMFKSLPLTPRFQVFYQFHTPGEISPQGFLSLRCITSSYNFLEKGTWAVIKKKKKKTLVENILILP